MATTLLSWNGVDPRTVQELLGWSASGCWNATRTFCPIPNGRPSRRGAGESLMNSDPIAAGLSPFAPERETVQAAKLMLRQIDKLVERGESFYIEITLAGRGYAQKIPYWKSQGYTVAPMFLALSNSETTIARVAAHVRQGGHYIPDDVVRRRFKAGLKNFHSMYKSIVNSWAYYDNSALESLMIDSGKNYGIPSQEISPENRKLFEHIKKDLIQGGAGSQGA